LPMLPDGMDLSGTEFSAFDSTFSAATYLRPQGCRRMEAERFGAVLWVKGYTVY
jgi:hypothetical protein